MATTKKCIADKENQVVPPDKKILIQDINPYITCGLCKGYFVDAFTITECLHTFCRSCLLRHCYLSLNCPTCDIIIHPTDPFINLRFDTHKQDIVYKLLPSLENDERNREKEFYLSRNLPYPPPERNDHVTSPLEKVKVRKPRVRAAPLISLILEYVGSSTGVEHEGLVKNFIRVTSAATIGHVQTFLKRRLGLDQGSEVNLFCDTALVDESYTLQNVKDLFYEEEDCFIVLHYGIVGFGKRLYLEESEEEEEEEEEREEEEQQLQEEEEEEEPYKDDDDDEDWQPKWK